MSELNIAAEVWSTMKEHINSDPAVAALEVVNTLIDNLGYSAQDIKESDFWYDKDIKTALADYNIELDEEDEFEEEEEEDDENYWEEDDE